jgi:hypothetical protein
MPIGFTANVKDNMVEENNFFLIIRKGGALTEKNIVNKLPLPVMAFLLNIDFPKSPLPGNGLSFLILLKVLYYD